MNQMANTKLSENRPRVGLVLSGGFGKGAYQIGALEAVSEYFAPGDFAAVSAASIGALNAYAFLTGRLDKAKMIWQNLNLEQEKRSVLSLMRSSFLEELAEQFVSSDEILSPLSVPLLNLHKKQLFYHDITRSTPDEIRQYLRAGVSIPPVNRGIAIGEEILFDGGIIDNIPVFPLQEKNPDYIICIYFDQDYIFENDGLDSRMIKISFPGEDRLRSSLELRADSVAEMMQTGYQKTADILDRVLSDGKEAESVLKQIALQNSCRSESAYRLTMDTVITNLNHLLRKTSRMRQRTEQEG